MSKPIPTTLALPSSSFPSSSPNPHEPITRTISFGSMPSRTPSLNPLTRKSSNISSSSSSSSASSTRSIQERRRRSGTPTTHTLALDLSDPSQAADVVHNATAPLPRTPYPQSPFPRAAGYGDGDEDEQAEAEEGAKKWKVWRRKARWAGLCGWGRWRRSGSGKVEGEK